MGKATIPGDEAEMEGTDLELKELEPRPFEETRLADLTRTTRPVRPLYPPAARTLLLVVFALAVGAAALWLTHLRRDLEGVSWGTTYGPLFLELAAGALTIWLAMRWSVPGSGSVFSRSWLFLGGALGLALLAALLAPHLVAPEHPGLGVGCGHRAGVPCLGWQMLIGLPVLLVALGLVVRGAPVKSSFAGALAGVGAGLISDAAMHLHCGAVDPAHTVPWHLGAVALLALSGALLGRILPRW